jgi:hypothetical protein
MYLVHIERKEADSDMDFSSDESSTAERRAENNENQPGSSYNISKDKVSGKRALGNHSNEIEAAEGGLVETANDSGDVDLQDEDASGIQNSVFTQKGICLISSKFNADVYTFSNAAIRS